MWKEHFLSQSAKPPGTMGHDIYTADLMMFRLIAIRINQVAGVRGYGFLMHKPAHTLHSDALCNIEQ
jgi:hypothetical protein